ncbi:hypothetical protein CERSUDRAFT_99539 [Gelatoporia subvermispora B]|uniref:Uncharacterized protein n=1 Tax=Ceriporiopsis subvermispora (strain B) TaxID=914234 RepID=M2PAE3_CERS8|nr:hypothetical protein CERSUDRAFT_99539 [Gelatoporia subvermispora B]
MFKSSPRTRLPPAAPAAPPTPKSAASPPKYPPASRTRSSPYEYSRAPGTADVLFGLTLPYQAPRSVLARALWRRRIWFETTFALSMLEPWEKVLVMMLLYAALLLLGTGVALYLPQHLAFLHARAAYYFLGLEPAPASVSSNTLSSAGSSLSSVYGTLADASEGLWDAGQAVVRWGRAVASGEA